MLSWNKRILPFGFEIASKFLGSKPYLFNDQVVVKLPNSGFVFEEHADNWYGPDPDGALEGKFKTINFKES